MPSPPRHSQHPAHESRQIQYRELPKAMQVGRNSVGRSEHFQMVVVYGLKPNDFIFAIVNLAGAILRL
jgi:hypothetical protein